MLRFEEVGDVEVDADGDMLPGVYSIPGVGFIVVGEKKETVIVRLWDHKIDFNRNDDTHLNLTADRKPWFDSKRLKLVEGR